MKPSCNYSADDYLCLGLTGFFIILNGNLSFLYFPFSSNEGQMRQHIIRPQKSTIKLHINRRVKVIKKVS